MLIQCGDNTFIGGPLDVILVLGNVKTKRYHVAFFEESPLPGPVPDVRDTKVVRLKSKMHHTGGAATWEECLRQTEELCSRIRLPQENILRSEVFLWDGDLGLTAIANNWTVGGGSPKLVWQSISPEEFAQSEVVNA